MAFNIIGAIGGAVAGFFYGGGPWGAAAGFVVGGFAGDIVGALVPIPKPPESIEQSGQTYVASLQNNEAKKGNVRSVGFGLWTAWYSEINSYTEIHDNEQWYFFYGHVSVEHAESNVQRIGTTPHYLFPGHRQQWMLPGEALTLFHPNVYTSPDVEGIELLGGKFANFELPGNYDVVSSTEIRTAELSLVLAHIDAGETITIVGSGSNDGTYTVTDSGLEWPHYTWITVSGSPLTTGTEYFTIRYEQDVDDAKTVTIDIEDEELTITFSTSSGANKISSDVEDSLSEISVGDLWGVEGSEDNDDVQFEVVGTNSSDTVYVIPAPTPEVLDTGKLVLLRRKAGPFYAAPVGERATAIGMDFSFSQGLFESEDDGDINPRTINATMEYRSVDDVGNPLSNWTLAAFVMTGDDTKPRRFSQRIEFPEPIRPQIRVWRGTAEEDDNKIRDAMVWSALRGYLAPRGDEHPEVDLLTTRVAIQVRASGLLTRVQQKSINGDNLRYLPFWDIDTQSWTELQPTRNAYWAALRWLLTQTRGRVVESEINLDQFAVRAAGSDSRGITFDANFDTEGLSWESAQSILGVDRARLYRDARTGLISIYRDEITLPTLMLVECPNGNCAIGDVATETPTEDTPTGVRAKFIQPTTWQERDDAPLAGSDRKIKEFSFFGCTDWYQSWAQAVYQLRHLRYRTQTTTADTEMAGLIAQFGDRVLIACARLGWGQGGQVTAYSGSTLQVWPEPLWTEGAQHYVYLQSPTGVPGARINCERGTSNGELILAAAPDVTLRVGQGLRTLYAMGHDGTTGDALLDMDGEPILDMEGEVIYDEPSAVPASGPRIWIVESGSANGRHRCNLSLRNEDERVHADPGEPPADPIATEGVIPTLAITGLTTLDGAPVGAITPVYVAADATPLASAYEGEWQYEGDSAWTNFIFGGDPFGQINIIVNGIVNVRMRAYSDAQMGEWAYTFVVITTGVAEALSAPISPESLSTSAPYAPVTSLPASGAATGGRPPYTYSWTQDSGDSGITINSPADYQTTFTFPSPSPGDTKTGVFRRTTTDADGTVVYDTIPVTLKRLLGAYS